MPEQKEKDSFDLAWGGWDEPDRAAGPPVFYPVETKAADPKIESILVDQHEWVDHLVEEFQKALEIVLAAAVGSCATWLVQQLTVTDGVVDTTPDNLATLRELSEKLDGFLIEHGYQKLVSEFAANLPGQLKFIEETGAELVDQATEDIGQPGFGGGDHSLLQSVQKTAIMSLLASLIGVVASVMQVIMFSTGQSIEALLATFKETFAAAAIKANVSRAMTAATIYYRFASDLMFQNMQDTAPADTVQKFVYYGPNDSKTRPFCRLMLAAEPMTRAQIDELDNGMIDPVWIWCGGYNCRHQWVRARRRS